MAKETFRIFVLTRDEIENLQVERLFLGIAKEAESRGGISKIQGKISFEVSGYSDDSRALWEIPEVILYFKQLDKLAPFFLYYIAGEILDRTVRLYLRMFIDPDYFTTLEPPERTKREVVSFLEPRFGAVISYCEKISTDEGEEVDPRETIYHTYRSLGFDISREEI